MTRTLRLVVPALTLAAVLAAPAAAESARLSVDAPVDVVTVYEDRALVRRAGAAELPSGVTELVVTGLPRGVDAATLRATATGAQVLGVELEAVHLDETNQADVREAEASVRAAARGLAEATMASDEVAGEWEMLRSLRASVATGSSEKLGAGTALDAGQVDEFLDFIAKRLEGLRGKILERRAAVEDAQKAHEIAQRRLAEVRGGGAREERRAIVTVRTTAERKADLEVSYLVGGAGWRPVYSLRVADDFTTAEFEVAAFVEQRTGEDWDEARLELTTARPSRGAAPPEPQPWRIHLPRPVEKQDKGAWAEADAPAADAARSLRRRDARNEDRLQLQVVRSGLVVAFGTSRRETVKSGARPARVALGTYDLTPDVTWTAFPRRTEDVFVTAEFENTIGVPLPAGETRVFVGPDYMGPSQLADWPAGEEQSIGLGVDRQVTASRESLIHTRDTEGLFSKDAVHKRRFRVHVANHRDRSIGMRVIDQVPVSSDKDLEVEITENTYTLAKLSKQEQESNEAVGVLEWHPTLAAGGELSITFGFEVTHSDGKGVIGLD